MKIVSFFIGCFVPLSVLLFGVLWCCSCVGLNNPNQGAEILLVLYPMLNVLMPKCWYSLLHARHFMWMVYLIRSLPPFCIHIFLSLLLFFWLEQQQEKFFKFDTDVYATIKPKTVVDFFFFFYTFAVLCKFAAFTPACFFLHLEQSIRAFKRWYNVLVSPCCYLLLFLVTFNVYGL